MENPFEIIIEKLTRIENQLTNIQFKETVTSSVPETGLFTVEQAAAFLCLTKSTVYKMTADRTIPHFKVSRRVYFKPPDLEEWVSKHKVKTVQEIEQEAVNYLSKRYRRK